MWVKVKYDFRICALWKWSRKQIKTFPWGTLCREWVHGYNYDVHAVTVRCTTHLSDKSKYYGNCSVVIPALTLTVSHSDSLRAITTMHTESKQKRVFKWAGLLSGNTLDTQSVGARFESRPGGRLFLLTSHVVVLSPSRKVAWLGHRRFLPNPFQFIYHTVTSFCDCRRGLDWWMYLYTRLVSTSNHSDTAILHNSQITTAKVSFFQPAVPSPVVPWQRLLTMEILQLHALKSSLHRFPYRID
jgi:hypothetical protein